MGVCLQAITGHHLNAREVINLPELLTNYLESKGTCRELADYRSQKFKISNEFNWKCSYQYDNTEADVEALWMDEAAGNEVLPTYLQTPFGLLYIQRKTVVLSFLSKYSFFIGDKTAQELFIRIGREMGEFFKQEVVIFFPDSMVEQAGIEQQNLTIGQIEEWANAKFGIPDKDRQAAIGNYYHIERL